MQIEQVLQMAKDHILKHGRHLPKLIVELEKSVYVLACPDITNAGNAFEQQHRFFSAGRMVSEQSPVEYLRQVIFIVEVWVSKDNYEMASLDPNREEFLSIHVIEVVEDDNRINIEEKGYMIEIIRDGSGELVDLFQRNDLNMGSDCLFSFIAGFYSRILSQEHKREIAAKFLGKDATREEVRDIADALFHRQLSVIQLSPMSRKIQKKRKSKKRRQRY